MTCNNLQNFTKFSRAIVRLHSVAFVGFNFCTLPNFVTGRPLRPVLVGRRLIIKVSLRKFYSHPQQYDKNNQQHCEVECCDCDCVSFEIIDVERRVINK